MKYTKFLIAVVLTLITMQTKAQVLKPNADDGNMETEVSAAKSKLDLANAVVRKPNIILILADDLGYKSLTCNGGNLYSTPNIDALAKKGMRFTKCYATPTCSPSRHLLLTGKYNFRNYIDWAKMDINQKTIGNMMKDAGYKTACYGKWQLDGGDNSLRTFGFDNYAVHGPYAVTIKLEGSRYKNPHIYTHEAFLPDSLTLNKYGPDIVSDSLLNFIDNNKSTPFFIYYPMNLVHWPMSPTPDDTAFTNWDPKHLFDTSFFPSMMHYMDKKIADLIAKLKQLGIENNTVIIFAGDNGTSPEVIDYIKDDSAILGGKHSLTEAGTHVPLIVYWPGTIAPGTVNHDLIDFTDFLPTIAGIANIPTPTDYGPLDGVSFFPRLTGQPGTPRNWIFYHYDYRPGVSNLVRWAQTKTYKLYDTSSSNQDRLFYNIKNDANEEFPIADGSLTPEEVIIKQRLLDVINNYVAQGIPLISLNPSISFTNVSVILRDTINESGGSTVTASGAVWSTSPNPEISSSDHTSTGKIKGPFSTLITGLTANTTYYIRAYATNFAGTAYSNQIVYKTLGAPVATKATGIDSNKFRANWNTYANATYRLDVSTSATFTRISTPTITEGFNNGINPPTGWTISDNIIANTTAFGTASPSLEFKASTARAVTKQLAGPAMQLSFWIKGLNTNQESSLLVEGFDGNKWTVITTLTKLPKAGAKRIFNATSNPPLGQNFIKFRFTYTKDTGRLAFDDVSIKYTNPVPFFVPGYNNLLVKTNAKIVTGLEAATNYYYRVRSVKGGTITGNSNVIAVTTNAASIIDSTKLNQLDAPTNSSALVISNNTGLNVRVFPNPSPAEFVLTLQTINNEKTEITVMDIHGKVLYRATGGGSGRYIFGKTFARGIYTVRVVQGKNIQTIRVVKGG